MDLVRAAGRANRRGRRVNSPRSRTQTGFPCSSRSQEASLRVARIHGRSRARAAPNACMFDALRRKVSEFQCFNHLKSRTKFNEINLSYIMRRYNY
eukprot:766480-Hanusia_phi.AAC.10